MKIALLINNKSIKYLLFGLLFVFAGSSCQMTFAGSYIDNKAEDIIKGANTKVSQNAKVTQLQKLTLIFNSTTTFSNPKSEKIPRSEKIKANVETSLFASFPNNLRMENYSDYTINQQLFTQIFNTDKYSEENQMFVDGKPFNFQSNLESLRPKVTKEQQINGFRKTVFTMLFPIFFERSLNEEVEFKYIGEIVVNGLLTDVIEAIYKDTPIFQLFFDKKEGLPVFMKETFINPITNKEVERKTYYSDYREVCGFLVAHKIFSQQEDRIYEEKQLKKLEINPIFKANLFEIKEK